MSFLHFLGCPSPLSVAGDRPLVVGTPTVPSSLEVRLSPLSSVVYQKYIHAGIFNGTGTVLYAPQTPSVRRDGRARQHGLTTALPCTPSRKGSTVTTQGHVRPILHAKSRLSSSARVTSVSRNLCQTRPLPSSPPTPTPLCVDSYVFGDSFISQDAAELSSNDVKDDVYEGLSFQQLYHHPITGDLLSSDEQIAMLDEESRRRFEACPVPTLKAKVSNVLSFSPLADVTANDYFDFGKLCLFIISTKMTFSYTE